MNFYFCWYFDVLLVMLAVGGRGGGHEGELPNWIDALLPPANEVSGKAIFSEAYVKNSVHKGGGGGGIPVCIAGGIPECFAGIWEGGGISACLAGLQAHTQGGSWGVWPGGGLQTHTQGGVSQHALRQAATAVGGTHPTGMHSCFILHYGINFVIKSKSIYNM